MTFNQAAINTLISNISSGARSMGVFDQVLTHEPKSKPAKNVTMALWWESIKPSKKFSGLNGTAGIVTFTNRIYINFLYKPEDALEGLLMKATSGLLNEYSNEFSFNGSVIAVDLLASDSQGLQASTGYVNIDNTNFRVSNLTVPIVIDNLWTQTA